MKAKGLYVVVNKYTG